MTNDSLFITNRFGEKLETLIRKPTSLPAPVVIFVAGIGADLHETKNSHDEIAATLQDNGFLTVQFSFAGRGKSEGNYQNMTLQKQADQVEDIVRWVKSQKIYPFKKIGIYAMSFGVPCVLRSNPRVNSLCYVGGAYNLKTSVQQLFSNNGKYNPEGISWRKFSSGEIIRLNPGFWTDLNTFDAQKYLSKINLPVMIIHGKADQKISFRDAQRMYADINHPAKKIKIIDGGDHGIINVTKPIREEFLRDVVEWFTETL